MYIDLLDDRLYLLLPIAGIIFSRMLKKRIGKESTSRRLLLWISSITIFTFIVEFLGIINFRGLNILLAAAIIFISLWNIWKLIPSDYRLKRKNIDTVSMKLFTGVSILVVGFIGTLARNNIARRFISEKTIQREALRGGNSLENTKLIIIIIGTILVIFGLYLVLNVVIKREKT